MSSSDPYPLDGDTGDRHLDRESWLGIGVHREFTWECQSALLE
jgi:hypothetical protein